MWSEVAGFTHVRYIGLPPRDLLNMAGINQENRV